MKAALLRELQKPLIIEEVPDPALGYGETLVRVKAVGICHSDSWIHEYFHRGP